MWDHVLVDEYQDTNTLQSDIVDDLCDGRPGSPEIFAVGDDAQAIYGFRAATSHHMTHWIDRYRDGRVVCLEDNYRSTQPICDTANALLADASGIVAKTLRSVRDRERRDTVERPRPVLAACADETAQADYIIDHVLEAREQGVNLCDRAVLFRTAHHADGLEVALSKREVRTPTRHHRRRARRRELVVSGLVPDHCHGNNDCHDSACGESPQRRVDRQLEQLCSFSREFCGLV